MAKSTHSLPTTTTATAVALYARVSTEDQAERQTVRAQLDFLRKYCDLHNLPVAGEYLDDGISGSVALDRREAGQRLATDAEAGRFGIVLVYRLDRLGRSLASLLAAHDLLAARGVAIRSVTEPFDTTTSIGTFLFQLLGSLAQLERSTIADRMSLGRNRVAGEGRYTGGPIPLGYDLDADNHFLPSERIMPHLGVTEADYIRDLFQRVATHQTSIAGESKRLTALGVPRQRRYGGKARRASARDGGWGASILRQIITNPFYRGESILASKNGTIVRPVPPLVDAALWDAAQAAMTRNRQLSRKNAKRDYWLRGMIICGTCGLTFAGSFHSGVRKYRCGGDTGVLVNRPHRCGAKMLRADWIEDAVWAECREFIRNPGQALEEAQRKLRERLSVASTFEDRRRAVHSDLANKETERERVLTLYRRGTITADEAETQLEAVSREAGQLRELLESMRAQVALIEAQEAEITNSAALLTHLRDELDEIERTNDWARKREVIERYVRHVVVDTHETGTRRKDAEVRVYLRLKPEPTAVENTTDRRGCIRGKGLRSRRSTDLGSD